MGINMMKVLALLLCCPGMTLLLLPGCSGEGSSGAGKPEQEIQAYASTEPLTTPRIFAPGVVSTALPEFGTSFLPDGNTVFFNTASNDREVLQIVYSTYRNGGWTEPVPMPFSDGTYRDLDPFMSPDGKRLYFSSNRPIDSGEAKDFDIWYVERTAAGWSEPINPGAPLNDRKNAFFVSATRSGTLYFGAMGADGKERQIYRSGFNGETFATPHVIELGIDRAGNPCIAPDESFLIFTASNPAGGDADLFISHNQEDSWTQPVRLSETVNSTYADFAPCLSPDGRYLFFTSERPGVLPADAVTGRPPGDIYQIEFSSTGVDNVSL